MPGTRFAAALALVFGAVLAGGIADAQNTPVKPPKAGEWGPALRWPDGKEVQWRTTPAPACDGSTVELKLANSGAGSGMAILRNPTFACVRGEEHIGPERNLGLVPAGGSASTTIPCACSERGGVTQLRSVDLDLQREGQGSETLANGCTYVGQYSQGKRSGKGVYACPDGYRVEGNFRDDKPEGRVSETLASGQIYTGDYRNGERDGRGEMKYVDKSIYDGQFRNGQREGSGAITYPNGAKYDGEWRADKRNGHGVYVAADNAWTYSGDWVADKRSGHGKLIYTDGSYTYEGGFKNDLRDGEGTATFGDGRLFKGQFKSGEQAGPGVLTFPSGRIITGDFKDHRPDGHAVDKTAQATFDGQWVNGVLHGPVVVVGADGVRFEGQYVSGKRNGRGFETFPDGSKRECAWVNDAVQGRCNRVTDKGKRIEFRNSN
jgi:hypothetical protein